MQLYSMILIDKPFNNFSPLPWYQGQTLDEARSKQNARKWWVYGHVYPLRCTPGYLPPFQMVLPYEVPEDNQLFRNWAYGQLYDQEYPYDPEPLNPATIIIVPIDDTDNGSLYLQGIPYDTGGYAMIRYMDANNDLIDEVLQVRGSTQTFSGKISAPEGTDRIYIQVAGYEVPEDDIEALPSEGIRITNYLEGYIRGSLYSKNDEWISETYVTLYCKYVDDNTMIGFYTGDTVDTLTDRMEIPSVGEESGLGQYYIAFTDGGYSYVSEVFTIVDDAYDNTADYVIIKWWDDEDFVMEAGTIHYAMGTYMDDEVPVDLKFVNQVILQSDIAKPEYIFEEEGETRDGYFFPTKMISEKRYKFSFLASEYLLDLMRFIRMADHVQIRHKGYIYTPDTFLISPEWEGNGDIAAVEASFDTDTVAKKIGLGYTKQVGV